MLTQRADANGRDTPSAGKVCWRLSALDRSERPIQEACDGLRHSGEQFSMVDQEPATYRPRRAYIEPDAEPAQPERPAQPDATERPLTATE